MNRAPIRIAGLLVLALAVVMAGLPMAVRAQGTCAIFKTYITGDSFSASDANSIQTTLAATNAITTCIDDDSGDVATMQTTVDPYPADTASLATTLQGELRRVRHVLKTLTGWSQWYTHSEAFVFPNAARFSSVGPHAFGGATSTLYQLGLLGTFNPSATAGAVLSVGTTLTLASGEDAYGIRVAPTFTEFTSGVHALLAGLHVAPTITNDAATATTAAGVSIATFAAGAGTTNAAAIYVSAAPTGATNNYALWAAAGTTRLGTPSSATGLLQLAHASSALVTGLQAGNATEANTYVLPTDSGTSGQLLQTDGATPTNTLSWVTLPVGAAATQAEMETASSTTVAVTPGRAQYHPSAAKVWGRWDDAGTVAGSFNVSSVTDTGVGDHTVNYTVVFSSANYSSLFTPGASQTCYNSSVIAGSSNIKCGADATTWYHAAFGDQ